MSHAIDGTGSTVIPESNLHGSGTVPVTPCHFTTRRGEACYSSGTKERPGAVPAPWMSTEARKTLPQKSGSPPGDFLQASFPRFIRAMLIGRSPVIRRCGASRLINGHLVRQYSDLQILCCSCA
ncbi:hypothetical protein BDW67DRAFT_163112 [Aspergillus spinulosporus]